MKRKSAHEHVRVRFAPSPTGFMHIGNARTGIFNWLLASHHDGAFLVRIEDTDKERSAKEYADSIVETLSWLGLKSDEPLVYQSTLVERHKAYIEKLLAEGKAYKCYCSQEELEQRLGGAEYGLLYDKKCRICTVPSGDKPYVVRFKLPDDSGDITFHDLILGNITVPRDQLDDFIIARSDGTPVYNLVVVVDDATMNISHVIRGQDHITNTVKQILLYQALNLPLPLFAHIPLILGSSGQRLSKRDAATAIWDYRAKGYLPEALLNYLARLGWSHGDQEIFTIDELIRSFTLDGVGKSNAVFDSEKLNWVNGEHIKMRDASSLLTYILENIDPLFVKELSSWSEEQILGALDLYKARVSTLVELCEEIKKLYKKPECNKDFQQYFASESKELLKNLITMLSSLDRWDRDTLSSNIKGFAKERNIKFPDIAQPIRIALTGSTKSPGVFALLFLLGKKESLNRIEALIDFCNR